MQTLGLESLDFVSVSLRHKAENRTNPWLPYGKGAGAERLRDWLESTEKQAENSSAARRKNAHKHRLPPRGSCRGATEGECAASVFLPLLVLREIRKRHFLKLEVIKGNLKRRIKSEIYRCEKPRLPAVF